MVQFDIFVSRAIHMVAGGLTVGIVFGPYLFQEAVLVNPKLPMVAALFMFITGCFNAAALRPAKTMQKGSQNLWRILVYAIKIALLLTCTPLTDRVVGKEAAVDFRAGAILLSILVGTAAKFYRESNMVSRS